jgi:hypothetical protein
VNLADLGIRKFSTFVEETFVEGGKAAARPVNMVAVAAILKNPWAGRGFVEDLRPEILRLAPLLGAEMTRRLIRLMPGDKVEAFGKAAAVGTNGEIEHGSALIHTLRFGNVFRDAVHGTAYLEATNTRNAPGALLALPMTHKNESGKRSHFLTMSFQVADAPAADEILIAIGASDGGRAHARLGDRIRDMAEMDAEKSAR